VVRRHAVDEQRADALLLEAARGAAERVPLRPAPVLTVDPAHPTPAAAEAQPHRDAGLQQAGHGVVGRVAHERERLEQDDVRRIGLPRTAEQADRLRAVRRVEVTVEAEGHRDLAVAARLGDRLAREPDALTRHVHPVDGAGRAPDPRAAVAQRRGQAPGVGRDDVAARLRVAAVHGTHVVGRVEDRAQTPEMLLALRAIAGDLDELGTGRAVQHHAPVTRDEVHDPRVGIARELTRSPGTCDDGT
jgi:hypothetical protein